MSNYDAILERLARLEELERIWHSWANKAGGRLDALESRVGIHPANESFNDLSCRIGTIDYRLKQLENKRE